MNRHHIILMLASSAFLAGCKGGDNEPKTVEKTAVKTMTVARSTVGGTQKFSGTVEETTGSVLSFSVSGTLKSINVSTGTRVSKGQLIAIVDEATLRNAHEIALSTLRQAEDACSRMKQLHDAGSLPEIQWIEIQSRLEQAQASERIAKKNLADSRLYAPFSGVISEKSVEAGQNVIPGMPVVKLVKIENVKVKMSVPENEISKVGVGQRVLVTVSALGGAAFYGKVVEKGVEANPLTRSYEVKALLENREGRLMPGMICDASLLDGNAATAILLPANIVQIDSDNRYFVWIAKGGKAQKRYIETEAVTDSGVTIVSGLAEGDEVIIEGQQKVSEGSSVKNQE